MSGIGPPFFSFFFLLFSFFFSFSFIISILNPDGQITKVQPNGVPRGTVGTSDEGFGGLVGYDACLTRRRSSVRLRPEIQLFFLHVWVRRQSERENIMQATFKLRAKSA